MRGYHPLFISMILLALASFLAVFDLGPHIRWEPVLAGILLTLLSTFLRMYKSHLLVNLTALASYRAVQTMIPNFSIEIFDSPFEMMVNPIRQSFGHLFGTGFLLSSKIFEYIILGTAGFVSIFYLIFVNFGKYDPLPFLGLWLFLLALVSLIIRAFPMFKGARIYTPVVALELTAWIIDTFAVWAFLSCFYSINPGFLFLPTAILILASRLPNSYYGLGFDELVWMLVMSAFKIALFPAFASAFLWDASRIVGGLVFTGAWRNLEMRRRMQELV